ncbi:MAG TPA: GNAT family N-acetyltransferase [Gemmatimonadaceae bacterium]|jgi:GNAT superfamily N-acetyltransferase
MTHDNTIDIRDANAADVPALAALVAELGYPTPEATMAVRLDAMIDAGEKVLVAERDGDVVGLLTLHVTPVLHRPTAVGRLTALVVAERARGAGVGRSLVAAAEHILAARGCALIEVTSNQRRTDAHAFYQRLGYDVTSLRFKKDLEATYA